MISYAYIPKESQTLERVYDRKSKSNTSVSENWITLGIRKNGAQITFVEYDFYDLDPDGVRDAYDCMYDSVHEIDIDTTQMGNVGFTLYALYGDGRVERNADIDMKSARSVFAFTDPISLTNDEIIALTESLEGAPKVNGAIDNVLESTVLYGKIDTGCAIYLKSRT